MIRWTGLAPWEFEFPFPGSLTSTFLLQVDTEVSGENKALAMEATIRAYPTFHLYLNSQRVHRSESTLSS